MVSYLGLCFNPTTLAFMVEKQAENSHTKSANPYVLIDCQTQYVTAA
jgi:hypothetical protein